MKRAVVIGLHHGMILNIQAKPRLVDSKLILLIRKQAQVNRKCVQNPGGQVSGGARIWISRPSEPKLRVLPKVTQAGSMAVIPWILGHKLWAAENEWELSTSPGNMEVPDKSHTHTSPSKLLKHTKNGIWPVTGEKEGMEPSQNKLTGFTVSFIYKNRN